MNKSEAIQAAIDRIKGRPLATGTIVATRDEPRTWQLDGYDGINALLSIGDEKREALASEVFDVNQAINVANHYLNLGYWPEGHKSIIVKVSP